MALNIKNEEVHRLVEKLAEMTGESQTAAVRHAVEEKLERLNRECPGRLDRLRRIAHECAELWPEPYKSMPQEELFGMLYDERGLPK